MSVRNAHCVQPRQRDQQGFTLVELIAALLLTGLLTAIFGLGLTAALEGYLFNRANVELSQKAQMAMARVTREFQDLVAIVEISDPGQDPFIIYERVVETDGRPEVQTFGLHFEPAQGALRLYTHLEANPGGVPAVLNSGTTGLGDPLIDQVGGFTLRFFQGAQAWTEGMDPDLLSVVEFALQVLRPDDPTRSETFSTRVHLRNTGGGVP